MRIKARIELQLEIGDKVSQELAVAEALGEFAEALKHEEGPPARAVLDVPRGKMAYVIEKG